MSAAFREFLNDSRGVAMTEYAVALGVIVGTTILATMAFGQTVQAVFAAWGNWLVATLPV